MNFQEVTDRLCISAAELAEVFDRPVQSIRQMRSDPSSAGHRPPPEGWQPILARLARDRGDELHKLADELER